MYRYFLKAPVVWVPFPIFSVETQVCVCHTVPNRTVPLRGIVALELLVLVPFESCLTDIRFCAHPAFSCHVCQNFPLFSWLHDPHQACRQILWSGFITMKPSANRLYLSQWVVTFGHGTSCHVFPHRTLMQRQVPPTCACVCPLPSPCWWF